MISNWLGLSVTLAFFAVCFAAFGWGLVALMRALQVSIALNISVAQELAQLKQSYPAIPAYDRKQWGIPLGTEPKKESDKEPSSEFYAYNEEEMAEQEKIDRLRKQHSNEQGGLKDEELQQILQAKGATEE